MKRNPLDSKKLLGMSGLLFSTAFMLTIMAR
jgi:hypothetical protein